MYTHLHKHAYAACTPARCARVPPTYLSAYTYAHTHFPRLHPSLHRASTQSSLWEQHRLSPRRCYKGTRKACHLDVPLQSNSKATANPELCCPGLPSVASLPHAGQPPPALALSTLGPAQGSAHPPAQEGEPAGKSLAIMTSFHSGRLTSGPWPIICSWFGLVFFPRLGYHVAVNLFLRVTESQSWVFGAGKN